MYGLLSMGPTPSSFFLTFSSSKRVDTHYLLILACSGPCFGISKKQIHEFNFRDIGIG